METKKFIILIVDENNEPVESFGPFYSEEAANNWLDENEDQFDGEDAIILPCMSEEDDVREDESEDEGDENEEEEEEEEEEEGEDEEKLKEAEEDYDIDEEDDEEEGEEEDEDEDEDEEDDNRHNKDEDDEWGDDDYDDEGNLKESSNSGRIMLDCDAYGGICKIVDLDTDKSIFVQTDYDAPGVANTFGWNIRDVQKDEEDPCDHGGTDGTVDCRECGVTASEFISSAIEWINNNDGAQAENPGYTFDDEGNLKESECRMKKGCISRTHKEG